MIGATVLAPGTASIIMFGVFFALLILRVPVAFALGLAVYDLASRDRQTRRSQE